VGDDDAPAILDQAEIGRIFRKESGRSVATLIRVVGDIDLAEDAVQEAFAIALRRWPADGLPPNPGGWITTTARNRALDRLRRESRGRELLSQVAVLLPDDDKSDMAEEVGPVQDDRLRLIFTCCHPALSTQAQVALTLRLLGGLSTTQVARSFLVAEPTMARRLVRAKHKIKAARIPYRVPAGHELPGRLRPVLAVVYLVYTAGLTGPADPGLCAEGIRLARILASLPETVKGFNDTDEALDDFGVCSRGEPGTSGALLVMCNQDHDYRALTALRLGADDADYPGQQAVGADGQQRCDDYISETLGLGGGYTYAWTYPSLDDWDAGQRFGFCWNKTGS